MSQTEEGVAQSKASEHPMKEQKKSLLGLEMRTNTKREAPSFTREE